MLLFNKSFNPVIHLKHKNNYDTIRIQNQTFFLVIVS